MNIRFTTKEYRTLIELLHLADWVLHAHDVGERAETAHYRDVTQKIMSYYKAMGCEDLVEEIDGRIYPKREVEDRMWPALDGYDNATFWHQITSRLAERDAEAAVGRKRYEGMDHPERLELIDGHEQRWHEEFAEYGLRRLVAREDVSIYRNR